MKNPLSRVLVIVIESGKLCPPVSTHSVVLIFFVSIRVLGMSDRSCNLPSRISGGIIFDYPLCASSCYFSFPDNLD